MTDRNTISLLVESLFEDWIDKNIDLHPLAVENMRLLEADAIALLKEQKKVTVISIHRNGFGSRVGACPNCQSVLHYEYNQSFCGKCGQAVRWE